MKKSKKYLAIIFTIIFSILSVCPVYAKTYCLSHSFETKIESRSCRIKMWFSSYPPQNYKGLPLKKVTKVSNGYIGFYY